MLEKNQLEKILKMKMKSNDTYTAINVLNKEIKEIFTKKIKKYNNDFKFTDTVSLANNVEKYLDRTSVELFKRYYIIINEENHPLYELNCLVEIYNKLKEGDRIC